jgi:hypothetical protein
MKTIRIINTLLIDEDGVKAKIKNRKPQIVHLQQGDLDAACAVYSTMMILILIGAVKYDDIKVFGNEYDKRYSIEKLKKEFFELKGMHRKGNHFNDNDSDNIKLMLERSYSQYIKVKHIDYKEYNIVDAIKKTILCNEPALISIAYNKNDAHALVAIGIETDENDNTTKIMCLDPSFPKPKFSYWNSVIDLTPFKGIYNYRQITETGRCDYVQLQDMLIISKR